MEEGKERKKKEKEGGDAALARRMAAQLRRAALRRHMMMAPLRSIKTELEREEAAGKFYFDLYWLCCWASGVVWAQNEFRK